MIRSLHGAALAVMMSSSGLLESATLSTSFALTHTLEKEAGVSMMSTSIREPSFAPFYAMCMTASGRRRLPDLEPFSSLETEGTPP